MLKVVTFNVLSSRFTNITKGSKTIRESKDEMKLRYVKIYNILKKVAADIYCLQEVDQLMHKYFKTYMNSYHVHYHFTNPHSGVMTLFKKQFKNIKYFSNILTPKYRSKNKSYPTNKRSALFNIISINNTKMLIINCKLWGHPDRLDVRTDELKVIIKTINKNKNINKIILCGDFNETNYAQIENMFKNKLQLYNNYFKSKNFATSYHQWNIKNDKIYKEPQHHKYKSIDYFLYSDTINVTKFEALPSNRGICDIEAPYKNITDIYTYNRWPSDHAMLIFTLDI